MCVYTDKVGTFILISEVTTQHMKILSSHVTQDNWNCTTFDFTGLCQVQNVVQLKLFYVK